MSFRDALKPNVTFRLRPTQDLRNPRDAFRYRRKVEQRKAPAKELPALGPGPMEQEIIPATEVPRDLYADAQREKALMLGAKRFGALGLEWE